MRVLIQQYIFTRNKTFLAVLLLWPGLIFAAPLTFNTALPVAKGEFVLRQQVVSVQSGDDPSGLERDRSETVSVTALAYGVNKKWALFGIIPYRDINLQVNAGEARLDRDNSGIGDIRFFARYMFSQNNARGRTARWAGFAGLKAPTGEEQATDEFGLMPAPLQTGSGSWDAFAGLVYTRQTLNWQFDSQLSYQRNTEASGFQAGDILRLDASWQKRVWPRKLSGGVPGFLYAVIEANLIYQGKNRYGGAQDNNSNGTRLLLAPGLQYVTRRWIAEFAWQEPVQQNLNGVALELGHIVRAGIRFNF